MKVKMAISVLVLMMSQCTLQSQAKVEMYSFQDIQRLFNTQHVDGSLLKCLQAFELTWADPLQQKKDIQINLPHQRGESASEMILCEWDPVHKAWRTVKGKKIKKICLEQQEFDVFNISEAGKYGLFVALEHRRNVEVRIPAHYTLKSFALEDPTLHFVFKYNQSLSVNHFKIPVDLPPATARVNAVLLDRKGRRIELEDCPLEKLDELTQDEIAQGIWTVDLTQNVLLAQNKLTPKKQTK